MSNESAPADPVAFTPDELRLLGDQTFFRAKAQNMKKMKANPESGKGGFRAETGGV